MKLIIIRKPVRLYDIYDVRVIDDPSMDFVVRCTGDYAVQRLLGDPGEAEDAYDDTIMDATVEEFPVELMDAGPDVIERAEPGWIFIYGNIAEFRNWPNNHAVWLELATVGDPPTERIDIEIFIRQLGYGLDTEVFDPLANMAYLVAMPSPTKVGELDLPTDYIHNPNYLKYMHYTEMEDTNHGN